MSGVLQTWKERLAGIPGVGLLLRAIEKSNADHAKDMAASIAYFSFFSLFPLLAGVIAGASLFLERAEIQARLDRFLSGEFPGSADFIRSNIDTLIELRGAAGIVSVVGLLWSGSKMFGALTRGLNLALALPKARPFYLSRLRHFAMTIVVSLLLLSAVVASMVFDVLIQVDPAGLGLNATAVSAVGGHLANFVFVFVVISVLYRLVPYERLHWREVIPGALIAAFLFQIGKAIFILYVENVGNLRAVYGSLSSVIVLLLWLYFSGRVLLFGVEVIAARRGENSES
jgi:membrane protein